MRISKNYFNFTAKLSLTYSKALLNDFSISQKNTTTMIDPLLLPYLSIIEDRKKHFTATARTMQGDAARLADNCNYHLYYGLHFAANELVKVMTGKKTITSHLKNSTTKIGNYGSPHIFCTTRCSTNC